ncbi:uncharacterized protein LOC131942935 [Physella acuta]|uniref:uncharacterized protein LOC131942935 n=1 Tax=Physella acuta TaxID=109671 RepID=UPI0027DB846E|nr:uncharacterized protein LOC131942935 [Physella acuta]
MGVTCLQASRTTAGVRSRVKVGVSRRSKHTAAFEQFKSWLQEQDKQDDTKEEFRDYMRRNVLKFKEYIKAKEMRETEEREAKMAMYKQLERANMMKMLKDKLVTVTHEFLDQKLEFMHSILGHFLDFCKFDFSMDMLKRVYVGSYGNPDVKEDTTQYASFEYLNFMGNYSDIFTTLNSSFPINRTETLREEVQWFAELDQGEQFKFVLDEYINILCASAKFVTGVLYEAEPELVSYRRSQQK